MNPSTLTSLTVPFVEKQPQNMTSTTMFYSWDSVFRFKRFTFFLQIKETSLRPKSSIFVSSGHKTDDQKLVSLSIYFLAWYNRAFTCLVLRDIGPAVRVFANGPGDLGSIPGRVIPKTLKMELDTTLLNTQHYKVRFKGKVEQSWEWSSALPYTLV